MVDADEVAVNIWAEETNDETFSAKTTEDGKMEVLLGTLNQLVKHLTNPIKYGMLVCGRNNTSHFSSRTTVMAQFRFFFVFPLPLLSWVPLIGARRFEVFEYVHPNVSFIRFPRNALPEADGAIPRAGYCGREGEERYASTHDVPRDTA